MDPGHEPELEMGDEPAGEAPGKHWGRGRAVGPVLAEPGQC